MSDQITQRIVKAVGVSDLTDILADKLSGTDLHSLLLSVIKRRIEKTEPRKLSAPDAASVACSLDGRLVNRLEGIACEIAADYEAIELSPVTPLGAVATLTGLDQGNVLSTIRPFECASDPTVGMALECARRRKEQSTRKSITRLCTNQRVLRFPVPSKPGFTAHFKLFSLVTAGRDSGSFSFEIESLRGHIDVYLSLLAELNTREFSFEDTVVELSDTRVVAHLCSLFKIDRERIREIVRARDYSSTERILAEHSGLWLKSSAKPSIDLEQYDLPEHFTRQLARLEQDVCEPLSSKHQGTKFSFNLHRLTGLGYYDGPCFHIKTKAPNGESFALADGGFVNWTQVLLSDNKERLMTSGIGTELMCRLFRRVQTR